MLRRLGLVVHPTRKLDRVLEALEGWAERREVRVGQLAIDGQTRAVAEPVEVADCDLVVALGGDGTTLSALHAAAASSRPVLGIACGSVGVLTSTAGDHVVAALDEIDAGRWTPVELPALELAGSERVAINDVTVIRDGLGQLIVSVTLDAVLYVRLAGDGLVVATPIGSSAYTLAAGGPLLAPGVEGMVVTPLAPHGGSAAPLVAAPGSELTLAIDGGHGGWRCELDGRRVAIAGPGLAIRWRAGYATLVQLAGEESRLSGLRRRGLVLDSPRVHARELREARFPEHG